MYKSVQSCATCKCKKKGISISIYKNMERLKCIYIYLNIPSSEFHHLLPHSKFPHTFPHSEFPLICSLSEFLLTLLLKFPVHPSYLRIPSLSFFQNALTPSVTQNCLWNLSSLRIPSHSSALLSLGSLFFFFGTWSYQTLPVTSGAQQSVPQLSLLEVPSCPE